MRQPLGSQVPIPANPSCCVPRCPGPAAVGPLQPPVPAPVRPEDCQSDVSTPKAPSVPQHTLLVPQTRQRLVRVSRHSVSTPWLTGRQCWGKRTVEPSAAGAQGGGQRQWVPGSAQSSEGQCRQYRGPGPERNRQGGPAQPGLSESSQTRRRASADQVSHRAAFEPAIFPGNGQHEVWAAN
jgi:hypothetical protein